MFKVGDRVWLKECKVQEYYIAYISYSEVKSYYLITGDGQLSVFNPCFEEALIPDYTYIFFRKYIY
jgi:hypothetical protein